MKITFKLLHYKLANRADSATSATMSTSSRQYTLLIGGQKVGKTSIMEKLINNKFNTIVEPTFGPDLYRYSIDNKRINVLEIGGEDKCYHIVQSYCELANAFIVVYDITSYESFVVANYWVNYIRQHLPLDSQPLIVLVGNKLDDQSNRQVNLSSAEQFAKNHNLILIETSALSGENLTDIFKAIARPNC